MLYDVRLDLRYDYPASVHGDRHLIRVTPANLPGRQRVVASALTIDPRPDEQTTRTDYFGNSVTTIAYADYHDHLDVRMSARVQVSEPEPPADLSPTLDGLRREIGASWTVSADAPHHFLAPSPRIAQHPMLTAFAAESFARTASVEAAAMDFCLAIHRSFAYDKDATTVDTTALEAFEMRAGVCQDFSQVMIAGLRGLGVPAGYVSGYLRTLPPAGRPRLEGTDAMHAWVRVWCGGPVGWVEMDPTNAMRAGADHITIGHGRDYADISPIVGVLRTSGGHEASQSVDVVVVE